MAKNKRIQLEELLKLRGIYLELKELAAIIQDFEDSHIFADSLKKSLDRCVTELSDAGHILYKDIYTIRKENSL